MTRQMYYGVNGVARKITKAYIGVNEEEPIYGNSSITIDNTNISNYFSISNGTYGFIWNSSDNAFSSNNGGVNSSTATSTWTALKDLENFSFSYSYSSESGYDKFTLSVAGTTVVSNVSGSTTIKTWSGSLSKGQTIVMTYSKDGSVSSNSDKCKIYNIANVELVQTGTNIKPVARKIKKIYISVDGVARCIFGDKELSRYGTITELSVARSNLTATTVGNLALFAGGYSMESLTPSAPEKY